MATGRADSSSQTGAEPPKPDRSRHGARDMVLSLVVLVVVLLGVLLVTGSVRFSPGGPDVKASSGPTRNPHAELRADAQRVPFALRDPQVPAQWRSNSAGVVPIGTGAHASVDVQVGWVTPHDAYLRLSQSAGGVDDLVRNEAGLDRGNEVTESGTVVVAGRTWHIYPGRRAEQSWVATFGGVHVLITGSAGGRQFRTLAQALPEARVLPPAHTATG